MSHTHRRKEKNCLNCNANVRGRYCHVCGQENVEPKQSVAHLVMHFFNDITHFDGKFFKSIWLLFRKPGFLPRQYMLGKRASYLDPVRMYVFTSAMFFLLLSLFFMEMLKPESKRNKAKKEEVLNVKTDSLNKKHEQADTISLVGNWPIIDDVNKRDSARAWLSDMMKRGVITTKEEYDAYQKNLPEKDRDHFIRRNLNYKRMEWYKKYGRAEGGSEQFSDVLFEKFKHSFPYLLFISLPLFALYLKLLYYRRKSFYYTDHGIFLIYLYIFTFIFLLVYLWLYKFTGISYLSWLDYVITFMGYAGLYYAYRAMMVFYGQGILKTLVKFAILNILAGFSLIVLFLCLLIFSLFTV